MRPVVNNLGLACAGCKDYRHAIEHLERVMRILEDSFGNTDVNLVPQLQNLGDVFAMAGRKKDAEGAYRRALMIAGGRRRPDPEETKELEARITQLAANTRPRSAGNLWVLPSGAQWQVDDAQKDTAIVPSKS